MEQARLQALEHFALEIRIGILEQMKARGFGHVGGSLSIADLLAVLYGHIMRVDPHDPQWPERDKLVCSKGHAGPAVYAALALKGYFPYEQLATLNQPGTQLPSHCDRNKTPGIDMTTGSLGQGTSLAVGLALGDRLKKRDSRTFVIIGDGECNEGQVWEAAMFAAAHQLTNLVFIIDENKKQLDGYTKDVLCPFDLREKFQAFGFDARRIDGHDLEALVNVLEEKPAIQPLAIVMDTLKGKGVSFCEQAFSNHSMNLSTEQWEACLAELRNALSAFEKGV